MATEERKRTSQAVVFIHGIGDQTPGSSVRGFVEGLLGGKLEWAVDKPAPYISQRDRLDQTYELRRLHVWSDKASGRLGTDFFEFYWADLMPSLSVGEGVAWLKSLAKRPYKEMPAQMRPAWLATRIVGVLAGVIATVLALVFGVSSTANGFGKVMSFGPFVFLLGLARGALSGFMRSSLGDAARYMSVKPTNVAARQAIRQRGLDLITKLHEDGRYERIMIVGHSLGSVIAYDLVNLAWTDRRFFPPLDNDDPGDVHPQPALADYETRFANAATLDETEHQPAQAALWAEQRALGLRWLITDLITLGSPIAHAQLLMSDGRDDLRRRQLQREYPTCPPLPDVLRPGAPTPAGNVLAFAPAWDPTRRAMHVGAVFASTRWTNLYFPVKWGFFGDPVGGPVAPVFGNGIADHPVTSDLGFKLTRTPFAHSAYWTPSKGTPPPNDSTTILRRALGFLKR